MGIETTFLIDIKQRQLTVLFSGEFGKASTWWIAGLDEMDGR